MKEQNTAANIKHSRAYFEVGCLCLRDKKIAKQSNDISDVEAVKYYQKNCKCSRNYK